jgi:hypothetical protein
MQLTPLMLGYPRVQLLELTESWQSHEWAYSVLQDNLCWVKGCWETKLTLVNLEFSVILNSTNIPPPAGITGISVGLSQCKVLMRPCLDSIDLQSGKKNNSECDFFSSLVQMTSKLWSFIHTSLTLSITKDIFSPRQSRTQRLLFKVYVTFLYLKSPSS